MKNLLFVLLFVAAAFASCTTVYFKQPQPVGVKDLPEFPEPVRGWYAAGPDSLRIVNFGIFTVEHKQRQIALAETESRGIVRQSNGTWKFPAEENATYHGVEVKNDSLYYKKRVMTTKRLGPDTLLRSYKGAYYLSMHNGNKWEVVMLKQGKKGYLAIQLPYLDSKEAGEMNKRMGTAQVDSTGFYSRITTFHRVNDDNNSYLINPSAAELEKLVRKGLFKPVATFQRVK